jgi:hypothetical protein
LWRVGTAPSVSNVYEEIPYLSGQKQDLRFPFDSPPSRILVMVGGYLVLAFLLKVIMFISAFVGSKLLYTGLKKSR